MQGTGGGGHEDSKASVELRMCRSSLREARDLDFEVVRMMV